MNDQPHSHRLYSSVQIQQPLLNEQAQYSDPNYILPSSKKKGIFSKERTWFFIVALVIVTGIMVSTNKGGSTSSTTISSPISLSNSSITGTLAQSPSKVSSSIAVSNLVCTLVSAQHLVADNYTKPKPENQFIVVHIKLVNKSSEEISYNEHDFHAKSSNGNVTAMEGVPPTTYTVNNQLNRGQLAANSTIEGDIIFQIPVGDHNAQLTWKPGIFGNCTDYVWNLSL